MPHNSEHIDRLRRENAELKQELALMRRAARFARVGFATEDLRTGAFMVSPEFLKRYNIELPPGIISYDQIADAYLTPEEARISRERRKVKIAAAEDYVAHLNVVNPVTGDPRVFQFQNYFDFDDDGTPVRLFSLVVDVTEQNRLEARLARALRLGKMGYFVNDYVERELFWSDEMYEITGLRNADPKLLGMDRLQEVLLPGEREVMEEAGRMAVLENAPRFECDVRVRKPDEAEIRTLHCDAYIEYQSNGQIARIFGIAQDISDRIARDAEVSDVRRQLEKMQRAEALNYFASAVAHEVSNLLQPALNHLSLARMDITNNDAAATSRSLAGVEAAIKRTDATAKRMLSFQRGEPVQEAPHAVAAVLESVFLALDLLCRRRLTHQMSDALGACFWRVAEDDLMQVFLNLTNNAFEAGATRVDIDAQASQASGAIRIVVSDNGSGIPQNHLENVFAPFLTSWKPGGTGLGLTVVKSIVERNGGTIDVKSGPGCGTTFEIMLPTETAQAD